MRVNKVNIGQKFELFTELWSPRIVGEVNSFEIKLAKIAGDFDWHFHEHEDEMFLVIKGIMIMNLRDDGGERAIDVNAGEFIIIPHGIEHKPSAPEECHILLFEPAGTLNTGNIESGHTVREPKRL